MDDRALIDMLKKHPSAFGLDGGFREISVFLEGVNTASDGSTLEGFQEWLTVEVGEGQNLTWQALILKLALPDRETRADKSGVRGLGESDDRLAVRVLHESLSRYWAVREKPDGMLRIYDSYLKWLRKQSWYTPDHPRYLD